MKARFPEKEAGRIAGIALREDAARRDLAARWISAKTRGRGRIVAKQAGILAGLPAVREVFRRMDRRIRFSPKAREGARIRAGQTVATVEGPARTILSAERTALNILGRLSGVATLTAAFAEKARPVPVYDTRKTTPGLRALEKYAVRIGGGFNHRMNLSEAAMLKDNHLAVLQGAGQDERRGKFLEVEVDSLRQIPWALSLKPDAILLDNFSIAAARKAIAEIRRRTAGRGGKGPGRERIARKVEIEISGGIHLGNIRRYARLRPDRISVGRITHSAPSLDFSLELLPVPEGTPDRRMAGGGAA